VKFPEEKYLAGQVAEEKKSFADPRGNIFGRADCWRKYPAVQMPR
jgi:hypothetical protein